MSRMMVYAWFDTNHQFQETKFGDHFVPGDCTLEEAITHTWLYVRQSQFARKGKYFDSDCVKKAIWDVSDIAVKNKKFYQHSKIDDLIGPCLGRRGTNQGVDFHPMDFDELVVKVNQYISKTEQPLPVAQLAQWQFDTASEVIEAIQQDKKVILAELCARFGKTIWAGAISLESQIQVTVIASYVLTSFASFAKELTGYQQFRDMELVDCAELDYEQQIQNALANNKQVVAFLSMVGGSKRQDRIDYLFNLPTQRLLFVDEADYGAHCQKQALPFIDAKRDSDVVILMTGTNGDRAASAWEIDHYLSTTYAELLVERALAHGKTLPKEISYAAL